MTGAPDGGVARPRRNGDISAALRVAARDDLTLVQITSKLTAQLGREVRRATVLHLLKDGGLPYRKTRGARMAAVADLHARGLGPAQIAADLGTSVSAVYNARARARRRGMLHHPHIAALALPDEIADWLAGQVPPGATVEHLLAAMVTDAYFAEVAP